MDLSVSVGNYRRRFLNGTLPFILADLQLHHTTAHDHPLAAVLDHIVSQMLDLFSEMPTL